MRDLMIEAARAAGDIHKTYFRTGIVHETKAGGSVVTRADIEAEKTIIDILRRETDYRIIAEESGSHEAESPYCWAIDPLDGTNNFARGSPLFCVSIGLLREDEPIAGVVYLPITDEMYYAEKDKGFFLNGDPVVRVSSPEKVLLHDCLSPVSGKFVPMVPSLVPERFSTEMSLRACALELAYAAAGRADAMIAYGQKIWDFSAGIVLLREAGLLATDWEGMPWKAGTMSLVAARPDVHGDILPLLKATLP